MNVTIDRHTVNAGTVRLGVAGEVDLATCDLLHTAIVQSITDKGTAELIIDLDRVTFLDSTGLKALIDGYQVATKLGIRYVVTNPHGLVRRVLEVTGVLHTLTRPDLMKAA